MVIEYPIYEMVIEYLIPTENRYSVKDINLELKLIFEV